MGQLEKITELSIRFRLFNFTLINTGEAKDCCFSVTQTNANGTEILANCSTGSIMAELIDVQSADVGMNLKSLKKTSN